MKWMSISYVQVTFSSQYSIFTFGKTFFQLIQLGRQFGNIIGLKTNHCPDYPYTAILMPEIELTSLVALRESFSRVAMISLERFCISLKIFSSRVTSYCAFFIISLILSKSFWISSNSSQSFFFFPISMSLMNFSRILTFSIISFNLRKKKVFEMWTSCWKRTESGSYWAFRSSSSFNRFWLSRSVLPPVRWMFLSSFSFAKCWIISGVLIASCVLFNSSCGFILAKSCNVKFCSYLSHFGTTLILAILKRRSICYIWYLTWLRSAKNKHIFPPKWGILGSG